MSVDQMLWSMTDVDSTTDKVRVSKETVRAIAAALKAGQAMRVAMFDESKSDMDAADAWDAAAANASLNASEWLSNAGKKELERLKKKEKLTNKEDTTNGKE